jgi:hypothetical protein
MDNDRHILAEIESSILHDDPELANRMTRLSSALAQPTGNLAHQPTATSAAPPANPPNDAAADSARRDKAITVIVVVMIIALLTAMIALGAYRQATTTPQPTDNMAPASESVPGH